ncbi:MAG: sulfotransferase [Moorea sp. SIO2B7]|nr:sulfotransferase [Moorena sp. SIO2B7]
MKEDIALVSEPIFLVGAERSGTTLLRLMLDHHPQIAFYSEFEYAVDLIKEGNWPQLNDYYEFLETDRIFQSSGFVIDRSLSYPQLINSFLCQKRDRAAKSLAGATVHRHFDRLLLIWPDARFIHIIRDGRDVARSCIGMNWAGNVWTGVERWLEAEQLWVKLRERIPPERRIEVSYESLISEPVKTLTLLCNFIGISYDSAMLSYHQTTTYDFPDPDLIRQWRNKLSDYEIQLVESRIRNMLVERGYELSGLPAIRVTSAMERKLRLQDRWASISSRIRIYGLPLFVSDYLSRHLGLKQWHRRVKFKWNAIDTSRIK